MAPQKKKTSKAKMGKIEPVETLADSMKGMMKVQNAAHAAFGEKAQHGDFDAILSGMSSEVQAKTKKLKEEAEKELAMKIVCKKLGLLKGGRQDDGDQSQLKGDKADVLSFQWSEGMDYHPENPNNNHLSEWLRTLWRGDYEAMMVFINKVEEEEVNQLLEVRESLFNVSAVFHVIIGARTLCGQNPVFRNIQLAAARVMDVKNEHEKILAKLIKLGANIHAKDIAGYTPLHHCLTSISNSTTLSMARQLLKAGADPNLQNRFGFTALFEPVMAAKFDAVKLLLEFGADPEIKEYDSGISCRYQASFLPKIAELFCQADKKKTKQARADAKTEAGGSLSLCKVCGVDGENKRCTGCYMVWYCGQKCQMEGWPSHKVECKVTRNQYKKALLEDQELAGKDFITKEIYVHKLEDVPRKNHFVVKVQVPHGSLKGSMPAPIAPGGAGEPLFVYNRDRSLCGQLGREGCEEVYDMLVKSIREEGFQGWKGFYYAIYSGKGEKVLKGGKYPKSTVEIQINPVKILPVENW